MQGSDLRAGGGQIDRIVFLTLRPVSSFEEERWCFSYLRSQGYDVAVLELTKLMNKGEWLCNSVINSVVKPLQGDYIHRVNSYKELESLVQQFSRSSLFVDYVVGVSAVTLKEERIFRLLKRHNAQYTFLSSGALPLSSLSPASVGGRWGAFQSKVVNILINPRRLVNYLTAKVILFLTKYRIAYPLPVVIFGGNSEVLRRYVDARWIDKTKIIPIHSSDYDASILFRRSNGNKMPESEDVCVFLDEAATHHSDFAILGIEPAAAETYFEAMNRFFDFVESSTGLRVIVAAHPRSNYESMPGVFGGRAIIKGKTVELVAKCKLVVMHMSTSLSYAVLFKKPVVTVRIPGMRLRGQLNVMVETMGNAIGSKPIDIMQDELVASLLQRECNLEKYSEYEARYVKTEGADALPGWEIVAKNVRSIRLHNELA